MISHLHINNIQSNIFKILLLFYFLSFFGVSSKNSPNVTLLTLGDLWESRGLQKNHLFPTKTSSLYPEFAAIPVREGESHIHLTKKDVDNQVDKISSRKDVLIHSICSYVHLNVTFFALNTIRGAGRSEILIDANMTEIENKMAEMTNRRIKINFICVGANNDTYSAVWHHSNEFVWHFIVESGPITDIVEKDRLQMTRGYYADCFQTYRNDNTSKAIIIWRKGFGKKYKIQYGTHVNEMLIDMEGQTSELKPVQLSSLPRQGHRRLIPRWILWHGEQFTWANNRTIPKYVTAKGGWATLTEAIEMRMRQYDTPSISIHVLKNDKDEYSGAFGLSDILQNVRATSKHRYRIASVSKIITAMGIGELLTKYKLDLLSPVFGKNGVLSADLCQNCHPFLSQIRIIHLLEHSSGAWPHTSKFEFDRMEQNQTEFLTRVLREELPILLPGQRHMYSNVGYILLGRIISKVSGKDYESFINENILHPLDINATIGEDGDPYIEASYYSHDNANAYTSWNPKRLNSAAGWSMTAKDVAKIFNHLEKNKLRKYRWIITPSLVRWNYGRGIQLGADGSIYHIGSLAGTEAIGYSWKNIQIAILTNIRGKEQNEQTGWMEKICRNIVDGKYNKL